MFHQIIFPQIERILDDKNLSYYINNERKLMVTCPVCGMEYCYCVLKDDSTRESILKNIMELPSFFESEFEFNCPFNKHHYLVGDI